MSEPLVELTDVVARRGAFELQVPTWRVEPGTVVGVVGPNGAGKTTLLRLLPGLDRAQGGRVRVLGMDPIQSPVEVRSSLGFMTDDLPLFDLRIGALCRTLSGYYPTWDADLVDQLLDRFELQTGARVRSLSRGQGTRLRLLVAMAFCPRVLVLDEPATGLDVLGRRRLLESVLEVVQDSERAVVVSSHLLTDLERVADRLLVLDRGRVVADGPTPDLVGQDRTLEEALLAWQGA